MEEGPSESVSEDLVIRLLLISLVNEEVFFAGGSTSTLSGGRAEISDEIHNFGISVPYHKLCI